MRAAVTLNIRILSKLKERAVMSTVLDEELRDCESLLDVGCGTESPIDYLKRSFPDSLAVDGFMPSIEKSRAAGRHREYLHADIRAIGTLLAGRTFDCVVMFDVIEHLTKEEGRDIIPVLERLARKKVVIFTPNGFLPQREFDGNKYQVHLSGWHVDEMRARGYRVYGMNGLKFLRGEFSRVKWWPRPFWRGVSLLSQFVVSRRPEMAFAILCIKDMD
jgi:SAM-dependent methyltransferase